MRLNSVKQENFTFICAASRRWRNGDENENCYAGYQDDWRRRGLVRI